MKNIVLSEMTCPELSKYKEYVELALIPTGSHEQHGSNMTFAADTDIVYEICKLLGKKFFPRILVCPPISYGISYHHMKFYGTITLRPETFISIIMDIGWSLKQHGINKILIVNAHGGNKPSLGIAIGKLKNELGIKASWIGGGSSTSNDLLNKRGVSKINGHSCEGEVSQGMYIAPWLVRKDSLSAGKLKNSLYKEREWWWGEIPWSFEEITENGALGDATKSSVELGKEMTELILRRLEEFIRKYYFKDHSR